MAAIRHNLKVPVQGLGKALCNDHDSFGVLDTVVRCSAWRTRQIVPMCGSRLFQVLFSAVADQPPVDRLREFRAAFQVGLHHDTAG
jgi:hypothetical protein